MCTFAIDRAIPRFWFPELRASWRRLQQVLLTARACRKMPGGFCTEVRLPIWCPGWSIRSATRTCSCSISGQSQLVSHAAGSALDAANGESFPIGLSADGRYVAYSSRATNLVAGLVDSKRNG